MNTDTPRTTAAVKKSDGQWSFVLRDECMKLERELHQWRDVAERLAHELNYYLDRVGGENVIADFYNLKAK